MSQLIPSSRTGKVCALLVLILVGGTLTTLMHQRAEAAPYMNPFWTNDSPLPESAIEKVAARALVREGARSSASTCAVHVDVRTGELFLDHSLFTTPGVVGDNVFALRWRSMISGESQLGQGMLPSWETTVQKVILNAGDPDGPNGHRVDVRHPSGRVDAFMWNGTAYVAPAGVFDTLTTVSGNYRVTDDWGNWIEFDVRGMPAKLVDRNGNTSTLTYDSAYKMIGYTDDRGQSYPILHNANNYISQITNPAGQSWLFGYDASDRLTGITTPATADQPSGITVTLGWDSSNRLTQVTNGRGHTVWHFSYVGSTRQVSSAAIDGDPVSYNYLMGQTDRTDRNGHVRRYAFSGTQVTKTCLWDATLMMEKYATMHYYSGVFPSYTVLPRGNRVDMTFNSEGNLTERRRRTQNTSINDPTDIVESWTYNSPIPSSYTDPNGNTWYYGYDAAWNLTSVTHPTVTTPATQTAAESWVYNSKGQVIRYTNEEGKKIECAYYPTGLTRDLLQQIKVDADGLSLTLGITYDSAGNVATLTNPLGHSISCTWDSLRRLTQVQAPAPLSYRIKGSYDGNGNLTQIDVENIDKDGIVVEGNPWITTTRTYTNTDDLATLVEEIDASTTRTTSFEHDGNRNLIRITKPEGNTVKMTYNARSFVASRITGEGATGESTEVYTYDDNGNRTVVMDGRGIDWTSTFDLFDRLIKVTDPLGHYTEYELDKNGRTTKGTRKNSSSTELQRETYYFDERERHWKTSALFKDPAQTYADAVTIIERLKTGHVKKVTNPRGKNTTYTCDGAMRFTGLTDSMGNSISYTLDAAGRQTAWTVTEIDGTGSITHSYEATYDELNRRTTSVEIDRTDSNNRLTTQYFHDSRSNLVFRINAEGNPVRWTFDGLSRMVKHERALTVGATINDFTTAQVTEWGFDKNDRLVSQKDDGNNATTWSCDALDRPTTMTYPDSTTVGYQYDLNSNITQTTDPSGNVVADMFDAANRNTSRSVTLATGFLGTTSETRTFDGAGRMVTNEDNDYRLEFMYAVIGSRSLPYTETQSYVGTTAYPKTVTKSYDANGNKATEGYPAGANLSLAYSWNNIDSLSSISDGTNTIVNDAWIGARRKTEVFQNGAKRTNYYTGFRDEIESVRHETSAMAMILRLDYGYNAVHDRTYERFGATGSSGDAFDYDKLKRLTVAWMGSSTPTSPAGNPYTKKIQYNYDDDGNRTSVVTTPYGQSAQSTSYSTNNLSEYTSVGGTTHVWDANGNLTDNGTHIFRYDYKNHIVQVKLKSSGAVVASYRYDALGRRVEKDVGGDVERHIRSVSSTPGVSHVVSVYDGSNNWQQNFVWGDEPDSIQMLEQKDVLDYDLDGNTTEITRSFYHRNALGSVMEITDMNQAVVVSYRYDPYGAVTITRGGTPQTSDPLGQHWTYTGRFFDEESGLYEYRARAYDPTVGRFIQRDPVGALAGPTPYEYALSRPTVLVDPTGLEPDPRRSVNTWHEDKYTGSTYVEGEWYFESITAGRKGDLSWVKITEARENVLIDHYLRTTHTVVHYNAKDIRRAENAAVASVKGDFFLGPYNALLALVGGGTSHHYSKTLTYQVKKGKKGFQKLSKGAKLARGTARVAGKFLFWGEVAGVLGEIGLNEFNEHKVRSAFNALYRPLHKKTISNVDVWWIFKETKTTTNYTYLDPNDGSVSYWEEEDSEKEIIDTFEVEREE